jgi:hypothetical protein
MRNDNDAPFREYLYRDARLRAFAIAFVPLAIAALFTLSARPAHGAPPPGHGANRMIGARSAHEVLPLRVPHPSLLRVRGFAEKNAPLSSAKHSVTTRPLRSAAATARSTRPAATTTTLSTHAVLPLRVPHPSLLRVRVFAEKNAPRSSAKHSVTTRPLRSAAATARSTRSAATTTTLSTHAVLPLRVPHPSLLRVRVFAAKNAARNPARTHVNAVHAADVAHALRLAPPTLLPQVSSSGGSIAARLQFLNGSSLWTSVSSANPLPITCISGCSGGGGGGGGSATAILSGQQAVTASAAALASNSAANVCVKALASNALNVYLGPSGVTTSTGMELAPGNAYCVPASNTNLFYVIAASTGASVSWIASN